MRRREKTEDASGDFSESDVRDWWFSDACREMAQAGAAE